MVHAIGEINNEFVRAFLCTGKNIPIRLTYSIRNIQQSCWNDNGMWNEMWS